MSETETPETGAYHTRHRPQAFEQVVGQDATIAALRKVLTKRTSQAYIFNGPSGTGKTTLARISAAELGCLPRDIIEVDAATYSGIDRMRDLQALMRYRPVGGGTGRSVIIDEAHALSKQAWDSLLKAVEEPNPFVFWFFCTTNGSKIPATIKTRCTSFTLKSVQEPMLERIVNRVIKREKLEVSDGVKQIICREAGGSPRQALTNLAIVGDCASAKEAAKLLHSAQESDPTLELCRFLIKPGSWIRAMAIVAKFDGESPEGVRIVVCNYLASVLKGAKSDRDATATLQLLEAFATPYNSSEGMAPLLLSIGRAMFNGE